MNRPKGLNWKKKEILSLAQHRHTNDSIEGKWQILKVVSNVKIQMSIYNLWKITTMLRKYEYARKKPINKIIRTKNVITNRKREW